MARLTSHSVGWLLDAIEQPTSPFDLTDLRWLGPPGLRDAAFICLLEDLDTPGLHTAPLGQRAVVYFLVMRSQIERNGIDGFAWNAQAHLLSIVEAFEAIGAHGTAALLAELGCGLGDGDAIDAEGAAVSTAAADFLAFRQRAGGPWPAGKDVDPVEEVRAAVFRLGRERPEAFADP